MTTALVPTKLGVPERHKVRGDEIAALAARNELDLDRRRRRLKIGTGIGLLAIIAGVTIGFTANALGVGISMAFVILLFTIGARSVAIDELEVLQEKCKFVEGLTRALVDEIAPETKVKFAWDTTHSIDLRKESRSALSSHGNTKLYFKDRWLKLQCVLADGTRLKLYRQRNVKTKKDEVLRTHRRLRVQLWPNYDRYRTLERREREDLTKAIKDAVRASFHDPPEALKVRGRHKKHAIDIVIHQWDAEFLPQEIMALIGAYLEFMEPRRLHAEPATDGAW